MMNIDNAFIKKIRMEFGITQWKFDNAETKVIVPKELTHKNLFERFSINESIRRYYYLSTSKLLSENEIRELKYTTGFTGQIETALEPYSINIYGAYHLRSHLCFKLTLLIESQRQFTIEGKEVKSFEDLIPYFKEYSNGFEKGFNEFEDVQIKPYLAMLSDKQEYANSIFDFIHKQNRMGTGGRWASTRIGFIFNPNNEIINGYEQGQEQGWYYRAWSIVFSHRHLFSPLFEINSKPKTANNKNALTFRDSKFKEVLEIMVDRNGITFQTDKASDLVCLLYAIKCEVNGTFDFTTCQKLANFFEKKLNKSEFSRNNPYSKSKDKPSRNLFSTRVTFFCEQLKATAKEFSINYKAPIIK